EPACSLREACFIDVSEEDKRENQQYPGMCVPGSPEVLAQWVRHIPWVIDQQRKKGDASVDDGRKDHQQNSCKPTGCCVHGRISRICVPTVGTASSTPLDEPLHPPAMAFVRERFDCPLGKQPEKVVVRLDGARRSSYGRFE